jgi:hypothetical protein
VHDDGFEIVRTVNVMFKPTRDEQARKQASKQAIMFWRGGFSKQEMRVFLLRLRKGRLLLSQQDEGKQKQKQQQQCLGADSLLGREPGQPNTNAKPSLSQWVAKFNPAGHWFI